MGGGQTFGGRGPERLAEPVQLLAGQEALVLLDLEAGHAPARVGAGGTPAPRIRQVERLDQNVGRPVGDGGHAVQLVVKGQDVLVLDIRDETFSERGHDVLAKHEPIVRDGGRLAVLLDILALVALGEVGDGRVGRRLRFRPNRGLPLLDSGDDFGGVPAGYLGGDIAMRAEGHALRAAERPGLDRRRLSCRSGRLGRRNRQDRGPRRRRPSR